MRPDRLKMHRLDPLRDLQHSPSPQTHIAAMRGPTSKGSWEKREGKGRRRGRETGKGREREEGREEKIPGSDLSGLAEQWAWSTAQQLGL